MSNIKVWLEQQSMTQAELARRLRISPSYLNDIVKGRAEITDTIKWRFAQAFGFDVAAELFGDGEHDNGAQQAVREHGAA
ncbi:MAG: helix-turn-helix transcriptional regulator [Chloroflexi bacterium]|nr:helix-turn-helix transcriptional regulator [Chloroflexota bacterium]